MMSCCRSFGIFFVTIEENEHELPKNTHFRRRKFHRNCGKSHRFHRNRRKSPSVTFWTKQDFFESMAPATAENFIVSVEKIRGEPFMPLLRRTESKFAPTSLRVSVRHSNRNKLLPLTVLSLPLGKLITPYSLNGTTAE